ncbi:MAG TPA: hypothetical protein VI007_12235 [bacterium]
MGRFIPLGFIGVAVAGLVTLPVSSRPQAAPPAWDGTPKFSMARAWPDEGRASVASAHSTLVKAP